VRSSWCTVLSCAWLSFTPEAGADVPVADAGPPPIARGPLSPFVPRVVAESAYATHAPPRAEGAVVASVADEEIALWNVGGTSRPDHVSNKRGFHVAPRVLVETRVLSGRLPDRSRKRGSLSQVGILAQTRNHGYWPIRLCYEASLRGEPKLRGKATVRLSIARSGRVSASRVVASEPALRPVATCVAEKLRRLGYSPAPPRRADVDVSIELSPGDAPLPGAALGSSPPAPGPLPIPVRPWLDAGPAVAALEPAAARTGQCYAQARAQDPGLWGRLALRLRLDEAGQVLEVGEHESRFPSSDVVACARAALQGLRLPRPLGGGADLVWALRLGEPPPPAEPALAENTATPAAPQGTVAESPPIRVRVGP